MSEAAKALIEITIARLRAQREELKKQVETLEADKIDLIERLNDAQDENAYLERLLEENDIVP